MADKRNYQTFGLLDIGTSKTVAAVIVAEFVPGAAEPSMRLAGSACSVRRASRPAC